MKKIVLHILLLSIVLILTNCANYQKVYNENYDRQNYEKSYTALQKALKKDDTNKLLWSMNLSFLSFWYFHPMLSIEYANVSDLAFNEAMKLGLLSNIGSVYKGNIYEATQNNFYQALAYLSINDFSSARVLFNRANDRQRMAKDYYRKEIQRAQKNNEKEKLEREKKANIKDEDIGVNDTLDEILEQKYSNLSNFRSYENFINPLIPYISGIFFMQEKDYAKAIDLLKESYGVTKSKIIAGDMQIMQNRKNKGVNDFYTWIIIEDGDIARKQSFAFNAPIVIDSKVLNLAFSLPILDMPHSVFQNYALYLDSKEVQVDKIANLTNMLQIEFSKQINLIITKEIISATFKMIGSYAAISMAERASPGLGVLANIVSYVAISSTNKADTRIAIALPNDIYIARVKNEIGNIIISGNNQIILKIPMNNNCQSLQNRLGAQKILQETKNKKDISSLAKNMPTNEILCAKSDNILYIRARGSNIKDFIIKGY